MLLPLVITMTIEIKVPSVGESVTEGVLSRWICKSGQGIKAGDPVFELETDKASQEIPSPAEGILEIVVPEGEKVLVGAVVGRIAPGKISSVVPAASASAPVVSAQPVLSTASPAARQIAAEQGIDTSKIAGSGRDVRVIKEDVQAAVSSQKAVPASTASPGPQGTGRSQASSPPGESSSFEAGGPSGSS